MSITVFYDSYHKRKVSAKSGIARLFYILSFHMYSDCNLKVSSQGIAQSSVAIRFHFSNGRQVLQNAVSDFDGNHKNSCCSDKSADHLCKKEL